MPKSKRSAIARVVLEYQTKTCIRLVPKEGNEKHYIKFLDQGLVCSSPLGMQYGYQSIKFGMCTWGSLAHEVMHSLGFFHEHTRSDRDQYITINWDNVPNEFKHNFAPCTSYHEGCQDSNVGYDYDSIMHYGKRITGTRADQITPKQTGVEIGQRKQLSKKDVEGLNKYYGCDPGSIDTTTQIEGSNCPPDKLLENGCEKWANMGFCGGTWMDSNCPTTCNAC